MGNCIHVMSSYEPLKEMVRVVSYNGKVHEFKGSTPVNKITSLRPYIGYNLVHHSQPFSPLPPKTKLEAGEVYHLVPDLVLKVLNSPKVADEDHQDQSPNKRQNIKMVVTKEQLKFLLQHCQHNDFACGLSESTEGFGSEGGSPRWRPSLTSIEEVNDF
ncbi:hypothetical protein PanWU01x14_314960 [Parasponia andersonii]|uniref:Uncharacterized protein n=1 Tax=Parasponia andersonii TaxID=3476 RepID=A0A2P5ANJ3_PARAD|nr:hypothetical protein PanWU01x14_314960 [Parasponia andersonii]